MKLIPKSMISVGRNIGTESAEKELAMAQDPTKEIVLATPETQLIENTSLEKLMKKVQEKNQKRSGSYNSVKTIMSVYNFLTVGLGMIPGELSLKDFKTAQKELNKLAQEKIKQEKEKPMPGILARFFGAEKRRNRRISNWEYYLKHGYFSASDRPFDKEVYCDWLQHNFDCSDAADFFDHCEHKNAHHGRSSHPRGEVEPTNIRALYRILSKPKSAI